ncbi:acyltransferase family protein [Corynebacterium liangguodongii]|uniref:acyltransferase family protein n=1 Tax=Corynebacterium liangguodongii TaxID=2079535 RepID=UPI001304AC79|nr:acyltransferase family protein [Corynebacterium liangguodongii]
MKSPPHRADLDGLRGLAIALVVVFHIFAGRVSGGVDIFLLLSGYFFLGSQLRYASRVDASFNPFWPIWRTLRRLVPVLAAAIAAVVSVAYVFLPQWFRPEILHQASASIAYVQNWSLYAQGASYDVASDGVSPLQHLWSMSVQGQFYLFAIAFSLLLGLAFRRRPHLVMTVAGPILALITAASFAFALFLGSRDQDLNYYSTYSRAWELTLGAVLAIYASTLRIPRRTRGAAMTAGLFMVATTGLLFDGATQFPGPAALYPIGAAALIILAGSADDAAAPASAAVLTNPVSQWLGRISYSLYVWHWPILIGATIVSGRQTPSIALGLAVLALSLLAGQASYLILERPLRQHRRRPRAGEHPLSDAWAALRSSLQARVRAAGGTAVALVAIGLLALSPSVTAYRDSALAQPLDPALYPGAGALHGAPVPRAEAMPSPLIVSEMYPVVGGQGCMSFYFNDPTQVITHQYDDQAMPECVYGDPAGETVVYLIGGSHAEQWASPLDTIGTRRGIKVIPLLRQGCPFALGPQAEDYSPECRRFNETVIGHIAANPPDAVVSTTTRPLPFNDGPGRPDYVPESYVAGWDALAEANIPFFGLRDSPWHIDEAGHPISPVRCVVELKDEEACALPREWAYAPEDPAAEVLRSYPGMISIDTADWFCTPDSCPAIVGNIYVYRDDNHISESYAATLTDTLDRALMTFLDTIAAR